MKYKPRQSNFEELQSETAEELLAAFAPFDNALERVKDVIAQTIDSYVDAIIAEQLAERHFLVSSGPTPIVMFCLGENHLPDGMTDLFYTETPLEAILSDLDTNELDESQDATKLAEMFERIASNYRERASALQIVEDRHREK